MRYSISIDHELKLIRYRHSGPIFAEDIEKAWFEFLAFEEFTVLKYNLLSDYRGGKFEIPVQHLHDIIVFMQKIENIVRGKKQALVVDDPNSVAAAMLFEKEVIAKVGFGVQIFSTEEAALIWLRS